MPVNRNALVRYRTLDNCLRNPYRLWTLEDLIDAVSDALYEYEGIDKGVSKRTVQMDIQMMRSDKLGYNAPIIVEEKKYYKYEDKDYSITNIPLTDQDIYKLNEVVEILKQFKGFTHFQELNGMVQKLEDKIHTAKTRQKSIIDFEKNEHIKGLEYIDLIYKTILEKKTLLLTYKSFNARKPATFVFHPFLLKEYRNRWFVLGERDRESEAMNLALDRIEDIKRNITDCKTSTFDPITHFRDVVGVTVQRNVEPSLIKLFFEHEAAPYVITKPIHHSQEIVERNSHGVVISLMTQINFELEREILGFGDRVRVIAPARLRKRIQNVMNNALESYNTDFNSGNTPSILKRIEHKGSATIQSFLPSRFTNHIKIKIQKQVDEMTREGGKDMFAFRFALEKIPEIKEILMHQNMQKLISKLDNNLFLTKAIYFDKLPNENWYVTWHQDKTIHVKNKIETTGFSGWTKKEHAFGVIPTEDILKNTYTVRFHLDDATDLNGCLEILPGSHTQIHSEEAIRLITANSKSSVCEIASGGIQIMKPLLLHASRKAINQKRRRVIHFEFCNLELPNALVWCERLDLFS